MGLLLPGERKSIEPMAASLNAANVQPLRQSLHHFVAKAPWSDEVLLEQVCNSGITHDAETRASGGLDRG
jgi:SRSO17 transposase